jgi:hypothetical protein
MGDLIQKRGRGRPPGSRNKKTIASEVAKGIPTAVSMPYLAAKEKISKAAGDEMPADAASLLEHQKKRLKEVREDLIRARANPDVLPRELAPFIAAEGQILKQIGEHSGASKLTAAKIFQSDIWQEIKMHLKQALAKHPEAAQALLEYCESYGA